MALIGLTFLVLTVLFFVALFNPQYQQSEVFQIISGFMEVLIINVLLIILLIVLTSLIASSGGSANIFIYGVSGLGILQLFYVVPRSLFLRRRQRWAKLKGVIAGAVVVALLNGGCWVFLGGFGGL